MRHFHLQFNVGFLATIQNLKLLLTSKNTKTLCILSVWITLILLTVTMIREAAEFKSVLISAVNMQRSINMSVCLYHDSNRNRK